MRLDLTRAPAFRHKLCPALSCTAGTVVPSSVLTHTLFCPRLVPSPVNSDCRATSSPAPLVAGVMGWGEIKRVTGGVSCHGLTSGGRAEVAAVDGGRGKGVRGEGRAAGGRGGGAWAGNGDPAWALESDLGRAAAPC